MRNAVTGANKTDYHVTGVNVGRDYEVQEVADIRYAVETDRSPSGAPPSSSLRGPSRQSWEPISHGK
jgi:prolyl-tRNA synthetase